MKPPGSALVLIGLVVAWSSLPNAQHNSPGSSGRNDDRDRNGVSATRSVRFVGVTTERFTGSGTRAAMTRACSHQFRGARMAFSDEYALSFNPAPIPEAAWVQPRIAFGQFTPGTAPFFYDAAGNRVFPELSCGYWTTDTSIGTVLLPSGVLSDVSVGEPCSTPHPAACVTD